MTGHRASLTQPIPAPLPCRPQLWEAGTPHPGPVRACEPSSAGPGSPTAPGLSMLTPVMPTALLRSQLSLHDPLGTLVADLAHLPRPKERSQPPRFRRGPHRAGTDHLGPLCGAGFSCCDVQARRCDGDPVAAGPGQSMGWSQAGGWTCRAQVPLPGDSGSGEGQGPWATSPRPGLSERQAPSLCCRTSRLRAPALSTGIGRGRCQKPRSSTAAVPWPS